jgi:hypothetical protein
MPEIKLNQRLVALFYILMRDKIVPGELELLVRDLESPPGGTSGFSFSNEHLEAYARELARRIELTEAERSAGEDELGCGVARHWTTRDGADRVVPCRLASGHIGEHEYIVPDSGFDWETKCHPAPYNIYWPRGFHCVLADGHRGDHLFERDEGVR